MNSITEYITIDSSVCYKCWEAVSFWYFLAFLIFHADMMNWTNIFLFTVNTIKVNILKKFAMVPLEIIINRTNAQNAATSAISLATCISTEDHTSSSIAPTPT